MHRLMRTLFSSLAFCLVASGVMIPANAAAPPAQEQVRDLRVSVRTATLPVSQIPIHYIVVDYSGIAREGELGQITAAAKDPNNWILRRAGQSENLKVIRDVLVAKIGIAQLILERGELRDGDKVQVGFKRPDGQVVMHGTEGAPATITITQAPPPASTFTIEPKQAADQKLNDGSTKSVLQFGVKWDVPTLPFLHPADTLVYFNSDNLLSTDSADASTRIQLVLGAKRSLSNSWYIPGFLELKYLANQPFSETSFVATAGATSILPWGWTKSFLWNDVIKSPISPELSIKLDYDQRLKQDPVLSQSHASSNLFRLAGEVNWKPIHLFPGSSWSPKDITLEIKAQWWYFPNEQATMGAQVHQWESYFDISLYIPISGLPNLITETAEGRITRLRIQYESGANEANAFIHTDGIKVGIQIFQ